MNMRIDIRGADELARALKLGRREAADEIRRATTRGAGMIRTQVAVRTPRASGRAARTMEVRLRVRRHEMIGLLHAGATHMRWLISGTGRFAGQERHWPNPRAARLVQWAAERGANPRDIAFYIGRRGGLPRRVDVVAAIRAARPAVQSTFDAALGRIVRMMAR